MLSTLIASGRQALRSGRWEEALQHFEEGFALLISEGDAASAAELTRCIGVVHQQCGVNELAREAFELSLAISEASGLSAEIAAAMSCIAASELHEGQLLAAESWYNRAKRIARKTGNESLSADIEQNLGIIANIRGDVPEAIALYTSSLKGYRRLGDEAKMLGGLNNLGMAYIDQRRWKRAARCFDEAERIAKGLDNAPMLGSIEANRAELYLRSERLDLARKSCDRAYEAYGSVRYEPGLAEVNKFYGVLYRETRMLQLADSHFQTSVEVARRCGDLLLEAEALSEWALVHLELDRNREALQALNDSHRLFSGLHARRELLDLGRHLDGLEVKYLQVVRAWGLSIDAKDPYTAGHCERVANYACLLAAELGITGRDLTWLRMGGYLHDVGKIAVPLELINKPGKLTDEEFDLMKAHTTEGDSIVAALNFPSDIRPIVRSHHERWDGSGYPDGLKNTEIPLTARILCLADVYDALTTTRSYRPAMPHERAMVIMSGEVNRTFDPELFPTFQSAISRTKPRSDDRFPVFRGIGEAA